MSIYLRNLSSVFIFSFQLQEAIESVLSSYTSRMYTTEKLQINNFLELIRSEIVACGKR